MRTRIGSAAVAGVIIVMFLLELARDAVGSDTRLLGLGALPDSGQIHHEYWRLITAGFLHYDLTHLVLNTVLLLFIGPVVERRVGVAWLLLIFLTGSLASFVGILIKLRSGLRRGSRSALLAASSPFSRLRSCSSFGSVPKIARFESVLSRCWSGDLPTQFYQASA